MTRDNKMTQMESELWKRYFLNIGSMKVNLERAINIRNEIENNSEEVDADDCAKDINSIMKKLSDISNVQNNIFDRLVRLNPEYCNN